MKEPHYVFASPLSKDEVTQIICQQKFKWLSSGICGKSNGDKFKVYYREFFTGNSFKPIFRGTLTENQNNTVIAGQFQMFKQVKLFLWVYRAFSVLFFISILVLFLMKPSSEKPDWMFFAIPIVLIVFSYYLEAAGKFYGKKQRETILQFFETTLSAQSVKTA